MSERTVKDVISFLARAWSENYTTSVTDQESFGHDEDRAIYTPDYLSWPMPSSLAKWRLYRYMLWSEAMHVLQNPRWRDKSKRNLRQKAMSILTENESRLKEPDRTEFVQTETKDENGNVTYKTESVTIKSAGLRPSASYIAEYLLDIAKALEKHRTEKVGLRTYEGYNTEKTHRDKLALQIKPHTETILDEFITSLMYDVEPKHNKELIGPFLEKARKIETFKDVMRVTREIGSAFLQAQDDKKLDKEMVLSKMPEFISGNMNDARKPQKLKGDENAGEMIKDEYEEIQQEEKKYEELERELLKMLRLLGGKVNTLNINRQSSVGDYYKLMGDMERIKQRLMSLMKKWQVGWKERIDEVGDDIDSDEFLLARYNGRRRFYLTEKRLSTKSRVAILIDTSGSISDKIIEYKKVIGVISDVLDFIGTKFAIFAFGGRYFKVIKLIRENWSTRSKSRLAGAGSGGGTPLADAIAVVLEFSRQENYDHLFIITDGEPGEPEIVRRRIQQVQSSGIGVSILEYNKGYQPGMFVSNRYTRQSSLSRLLHGKQNYKLIGELDEMPETFFDLITVE